MRSSRLIIEDGDEPRRARGLRPWTDLMPTTVTMDADLRRQVRYAYRVMRLSMR